MPQLRRAIILTSVLALGASAVVLKTTRAAGDPARAAGDPARPIDHSPVRGRVPVPAAAAAVAPDTGPAKRPQPGAPQVPEESATIRDDPTIAPDPKQSADNNVNFPNDI